MEKNFKSVENRLKMDRYPLQKFDVENDENSTKKRIDPQSDFIEDPPNSNLVQQYNVYRYNFNYWERNLRHLEEEEDDSNFKINEIIDGRISFAFEDIKRLPRRVVRKICDDVDNIDLSHNKFRNVRFLCKFKKLHTLVLDKNSYLELQSLPIMPYLKVLYLNYCNIESLTKCVYQLSTSCPNLEHLSLMGNPIANTFHTRCTPISTHDYRMFVIHLMTKLKYLDDKKVTKDERLHSNEYHATLYFRECPVDEAKRKKKINLEIEHLGLETIEEEVNYEAEQSDDSSLSGSGGSIDDPNMDWLKHKITMSTPVISDTNSLNSKTSGFVSKSPSRASSYKNSDSDSITSTNSL